MSKNKLSTNSFIKKIYKNRSIKSLDEISLDNLELDEKDLCIENLECNDFSNDNYINHEIIKKLLNSSASCQISDALFNLTGRNGVLTGLKSINNQKTYGRILTVKTYSDDWGTSLLAIDEAKEGEILFILSTGNSSAIWGELTSRCSKEKKLAGTVIYGAVRDIDVLECFDYPVFASETVPNAGKPLGLGKINYNFEIENIKVNSGDFLFADINGVVLVPKEMFSKVLLETLKIKIKESQIISEIKKGKLLSEILGLK